MYRNHTISVCFPCRNEGKHLLQVLRTVPSIVDEVIVITNATTDDSAAIARSAGATVYEDNRTVRGIGYGFAHIMGMDKAKSDLIVGLDADGTYPVEGLEDMVDYLLDHDIDFLSCSRLERSKIPFKLKVGVGLLNLEVRLLYRRRLTDTLSGMWIFRHDVRPRLRLDQGDWNLSPQIKIEAATSPGMRFAEYPIVQGRRFGTSHQHYFQTGFSHARWIFLNRFSRMQPWLIAQDDIEEVASER
jgi:glycosyltransferase involved in cell wall biosynthesis